MRLKNLIWVMALICKWDSFAWSPTYREFDTRTEVVSQPSTYKDVQGNEWSYQVDGSTVKCDGPIYDVSGRLLFAWPVFNVGWENWQFYYYELNQKKWSDNYGLYLNFYPTGQIEVYPWFIDSRASLTLPLGCKFVSQKCISTSNWGAIFDSIRWSMGASYDSASFYDKCLMHPETKSMAVQMMACKDDYLQKYLKNLLRFDTTAKSLYPCSATVTDRIKTYYDENLSLGASVQIPIVARRDARLSILPETTEVITESTLIQIKVPHPDVEVHYTIDGSSPNRNSPRCDGLMGLPVGTRTVKALGYWGGEVCTLLETANFLVEDLPDDVRVVSLNLDATGGSCSKTQLRRREGALLGYIPIPVKEGFDFDGWWTQREGGCQVSAETIITQSATFYAHWKVVGGSVDTGLYCVIDLSRGAFAPSYTVSYLDKMPIGGWLDEYKTTKLVLRRVESGGFKMGDGVHGNKARVAVLTKPFYIGVFEVTRRQWELVMGSLPPSSDAVDCVGGAHPVNGISYDLVRGSCDGSKWPESNMVDDVSFFGKLQLKTGLNFDLPTEAQWEYSCRAGTESDYNNGGNFNEVNQDPNMDAVGRYRYNGGEISRMAEVGSYQPNSWGLYDMHGNVWEWCLDWYDEPCSLVDPVGPLSGALRIIRGGGWYNLAQYCTSSYRTADAPSRNYEDFGFRVALAVDSEVAKEAIVYDANGGQSALTWQMVEHGKFIDELPPATLDGFEFLGWFTSQTGGEMVKGPLLVEESKVLYAHWRSITDEVSILNVVACQQYPQNGLVDITVTFQGASNAVAQVKCAFVATNTATKTAIPIVHITRYGEDMSLGSVWTRKFIWDAKTDVGAAKIDDIALTIHAEIQLGGVQLWEDGPYWAECNVGATKPEECGYYFWWGDTVGYERNGNNNGWMSVKDSSSFSFSSENCPTCFKDNSQLQSAGCIDSTGNLIAAYDAATAHLGEPWRMPTDAEVSALVNNCDSEWTSRNGVSGRLVKGRGAYSLKSIFLPAAGYGFDSNLTGSGFGGYCWSSTSDSDKPAFARGMYFHPFQSGDFGRNSNDRYEGRSVRPVRGFADVCATGDGATTHLTLDCRDAQETCTISFDPMGGSVDELARTVGRDCQVGALPTAMRDGYEFLGWFTAAEGGAKVAPNTIITCNTTYYAHWISSLSGRGRVSVTAVTAQQRYPWDGLVDIIVTIRGAAEDVVETDCSFVATNSATKDAIPVGHITRDGIDTGSGDVWKRKFIWDAAADVGAVKIDDVALMVDVGILGVQLWENGPYWAERNVGAAKPEECGYYFWWGDTLGHKRVDERWIAVDWTKMGFTFGDENCPTYCKGNAQLLLEGYIDQLGNLASAHDAATAHFGVPWRMPTDVEFAEMINYCTTKWVMRNGVAGQLVTGKGAYATKSIFLPAAGYGSGASLNLFGERGFYWSSTWNSEYIQYARGLFFYSSDFGQISGYGSCRCDGMSVRPVRESADLSVLSNSVAAHFPVDCTKVGQVEVRSIAAQQRYPMTGLVDVAVTIQGSAEGVAVAEWSFIATDSATGAAIPVEHITRNGSAEKSDEGWVCKFIWDANADVGSMKIDDVALTVNAKILGVQLWEDGPYWAECNVGALEPEERGCYFWWGDTVGYKRNSENDGWVSVTDSDSFSFNDRDKCPTYEMSSYWLQKEGYVDSTGNLVAAHDAATVHLGESWRMPTDAEWEMLANNCTTIWTMRNNVKGRLIIGQGIYSGKSIFLPAAGYGSNTDIKRFDSYGYYWSSTPMDDSDYAYLRYFNSSSFNRNGYARYCGCPVRPVRRSVGVKGFARTVGGVGLGVTTHLAIDCRDGQETCTISFDPMGGTVDEQVRTVSKDSQVGTLPTATREGYEFLGWFTAAVGGTQVTAATVVTADVTFYAQWEKLTGEVAISSVEARQRYPWNGLVDIVVTLQGSAADVAECDCVFSATNSATKAAISVEHITRNGDDEASDGAVTRKFIWDATADVGAVKIDDVALMVGAVKLGGVQLWENGPYWAECNVGATKPEEYGYYFWWGDTVGYKRDVTDNGWISVNDASSFLFVEVNCSTYGKDDSQLQAEGYIEAMGNLVAAHDAATAHLSTPWRMPTDAEFAALISNCTATWTKRNGVSGQLFTGKGAYSSKSIFVPAAGGGGYDRLFDRESMGCYWSATPFSDTYDYARELAWGVTIAEGQGCPWQVNFGRYTARSVRPVREFANAGGIEVASANAVTTHLSLDTHAGTRELSSESVDIRYVASWYENGALARVEDNGMVVASGASGDYAWLPTDGGAHTLKLSVFDGADSLVGSETAEFVVLGCKSITYVNLHGTTHSNPETYLEGTAVTFTPPSERAGYTFTGWIPAAITAEIRGSQTVTAGWRANAYQIAYDANGGLGAMADEPMTYDVEKALTACAFTRRGYTFAGWATSAGGAVKYADGATVKNLAVSGTVTLYAKWTPISYSVKFNANGGSGTMANESMIYDSATSLTTCGFVRTGYHFSGWAASLEGPVVYAQGASVKNLTSENGGNISLYAVWAINHYTVKFNANGGAGTMADLSFTYGVEQKLRANAFMRVGWAFMGWATSAGGVVKYADGATVKNLTDADGGVVTLYAVWKNIGPAISCEIAAEYRTKVDVGVIPVKAVNVKETVKIAVKGLPSGVKFTAKDIVDKKTKKVTVPANSIYGTPTKSGVYAATVTVTPTDRKSKMAPIVKGLLFVVRNSGEHIVVADYDVAQGTVKGMGVYAPGKKVTLKAIAAKGWVFNGWYNNKGALIAQTASWSFTMQNKDVKVAARFVTAAADKKSIALTVTAGGKDIVQTKSITIKQGIYIEWPVAASALSATTVKVSGLPSGLKFTAKDMKIAGTPKTASKVDKDGKVTPSKVKITVTTAGKAKQEYVLNVTVRGIPAEGTFNGGSANGLVTLTVAKTGKISGKYLADGKTWTLSAAGFDTWDDNDRMTATLTAKSGKEVKTVALVYEDGRVCASLTSGEDAASPLFEAWRNEWKDEPLKTLAAKLKGKKVQVGEVLLTVGASGAVTAKGTFGTYSASCSTVLIPVGSKGTYVVYLYFPPKAGKFDGFTDVVEIGLGND